MPHRLHRISPSDHEGMDRVDLELPPHLVMSEERRTRLLEQFAEAYDAQRKVVSSGLPGSENWLPVEELIAVASEPVILRLATAGPVSFGRGLQVKLTFCENAFHGTGVFLLGAILERFLARYVSINSFVETVVCSQERGMIARWPARPGGKPVL